MSPIPANIIPTISLISTAQAALSPSDPTLDHALSNSAKNSLPAIAVGPPQGAFLSILVQLMRARSVLEVGTLGGYSTIWFARGVTPEGTVTSIEYNEKHHRVAAENLKEYENVELLCGAALDVLPRLADEGRVFDFVFIDANWDEQAEYFDWAVKLVKRGGCVFVDNAIRQMVEEEDGKRSEKADALVEHVKGREDVAATMVPVLSTHRENIEEVIDGFVLAIKK